MTELETPSHYLDVAVRLQRQEFHLSAAFGVDAGESVAVLGPNGAGKSSLLGLLAGLLVPDHGTVRLDGRLLTACGPGRRTVVDPARRRVGLMGQDPLLFPHLSAVDNIAFGPRSQGRGKAASRRMAEHWLDRVGLSGMGSRTPGRLSGGQRQRVALARALAAEPQVLLLDEPLGALDAETVSEVRQVLRTHLRDTGTTTVLVTHDVLDAAVLADRVIVMEGGYIVDDGPTGEVLSAPRTSFGATLAGLNLVAGTVAETVDAAAATVLTSGTGLVLTGIAATALTPDRQAAAVFRPAAVSVFRAAPGGSPRNSWPATIVGMEPGSAAVRLHTAGGPHRTAMAEIAVDVTAAAVADLGLAPGVEVVLSVKATEVLIHQR